MALREAGRGLDEGVTGTGLDEGAAGATGGGPALRVALRRGALRRGGAGGGPDEGAAGAAERGLDEGAAGAAGRGLDEGVTGTGLDKGAAGAVARPQDSVLVGHSSNYFDLPSPPLNENLAILNGQRRRSPAYYSTLFCLIESRGVLCEHNIVDG